MALVDPLKTEKVFSAGTPRHESFMLVTTAPYTPTGAWLSVLV